MGKRIFILLNFICILFCTGFPQQNKIDSLKKIITTSKDDTNKVNILNKITSLYLYTTPPNYKNALEFSERSRLIAEKLSFERGAFKAYDDLGIIYGYYGLYQQSFDNYFKQLKISEKLNDSVKIIRSNNNLGSVYISEGNFKKGLEMRLKVLKLTEASINKDFITGAYWNVAGAYLEMCKQMIKKFDSILANYNYNKAIEFTRKALQISTQKNDSSDIAFFLKALAFIYDKANLCEESNLAAETNLIISNYYKEAESNYNQALAISQRLKDKNGLEDCYFQLGLFYRNQGNLSAQTHKFSESQQYYKKSLDFYIQALELIKKLGFAHGIASYSKEVGITYLKLNNLQKAKQFLLDAANGFIKIGFKEGAKESFEKLSDAYLKLKDYKNAYKYFKSYTVLKDSLTNESILKQQNEKLIEYETAKREVQISQLKLEAQKKDAKQTFIIFAGIGVILFSLLFMYFFVRNNKIKSEAKLLRQENDLRQNIWDDIHDEVGSGLTTIAMRCNKGISDYKRNIPAQEGLFNEILYTSKKLSEDIAELISPKFRENETLLSLFAKIRDYTHKFFEGSSIDPVITLSENIQDFKVDPRTYRNIFLIIKEALHNIIKHSGATKAEIEFTIDSACNFKLQIQDNGKGFDAAATNFQGTGLKSLRKRAEALKNGSLQLQSKSESTTITIMGNLS